MTTRLKVAVRVRPLSRREIQSKASKILEVENEKIISITNIKVPEQNAGDSRERIRRFTFDFCFHENSSQDDVSQAVENVIGKAIKRRYHSCVLAYGQSSSGKTHTMMGFPHDPGLTPKLCQQLFGYLQESSVGEEMKNANITVSYLEIYNEKVRDLLYKQDEFTRKNPVLKIRQHPKKGPYVQGLTEHTIPDSASLLRLLETGNSNRKVAATLTNLHSSRSHSVFIITFSGVKLTLVDLAGSERAGNRCYNTSRFREGANINKSLVALGNVISALAEETAKLFKGVRRRFIPYRDSVLTWLLKDTLGSNSHTLMIATISPASTCYSETVNTLRFGQRAKLIVSIPVVNEDPREKTIRELRVEITRLRELLKLKELHHFVQNPIESTGEETISMSLDSSDNISEAASTITVNSLEDVAPCAKPTFLSQHETTEQIIPVMHFTNSRVTEIKRSSPIKLRRTFSVDHTDSKMEQDNAKKKFGSEEAIPTANQSRKPPIPSTQPSSRKGSLSKSNSSLRLAARKAGETKKLEKPIVLDPKSFSNVEARVDSIRRVPVKPRSQIVAAVTHRLYAKTRKKDVSTDTSDMPRGIIEPPKELTICSNARLRLRELTKRVLKAHRSRNEETQTDLFPILRVKEACTDADDLKFELEEIKSIETSTQCIETEEKGVNCSFLETLGEEFAHHLRNTLVITRSCSTQSTEKMPYTAKEPQSHVSFTKYLQDPRKIEICNPHTANPIYTNTVNINISHNYINGRRLSGSVSDDSLEEQNKGCFATPDLISNHNSLESSAHAVAAPEVKSSVNENICQANFGVLDQTQFEVSCDIVMQDEPRCCVANCETIPKCCEKLTSINIPSVCATEICVANEINSCCQYFIPRPPETAKPNIIEYKTYSDDCVKLIEPLVLKSIMKHIPTSNSKKECESDDESHTTGDVLPDSLEYHMANSKKVRFTKGKGSQNERMMKVMSEFLQEATCLMNKVTTVASKFENTQAMKEDDFEIQVIINEISGLEQINNRKRKTVEKNDARCQTDDKISSMTDDFVQTYPILTTNSSTQFSDFDIPVNKYEMLLEDSCRRLEEKINAVTSRRLNSDSKNKSYHLPADDDNRFNQPLSCNHWDLNILDNEETSLESNVGTSSDYGSLPRRKYKRSRASCSPSEFLRQLAAIRKQVVETSRDELSKNHE